MSNTYEKAHTIEKTDLAVVDPYESLMPYDSSICQLYFRGNTMSKTIYARCDLVDQFKEFIITHNGVYGKITNTFDKNDTTQ